LNACGAIIIKRLFYFFKEKRWNKKLTKTGLYKRVHFHLQQATKYYNGKKYAKAEKLFHKVTQLNVSLHDEFYYFYGVVQAKINKLEEALKNIHTYIKMAGKKGRYYLQAQSLTPELSPRIF